jgi:hypothetical protein
MTNSPELYNITKAYIHIAVFNSKLTNDQYPNVNDLFKSCFSETNEILRKLIGFLTLR